MKLLVVVPYRDRESHLKEFLPYIKKILQEQKIENKIVISEQNEGKLFNRGLMCNIGFKLFNENFSHTCFHDVDMICNNIDYTPSDQPLSLLRSRTKNNVYWRYFGGVTLFPNQDFVKINGFSNQYWGWGGEDDDLKLRCDILKIQTGIRLGFCQDLETTPNQVNVQRNPKYKDNLENLASLSKNPTIEKVMSDGLSTLDENYKLDKIIENHDHTIVKATPVPQGAESGDKVIHLRTQSAGMADADGRSLDHPHDSMKTIYFVTSLPRTGTTSLCEMAKICGLKPLHILKGISFTQAINDDYNFFADTPFYSPEFLIGLMEAKSPDIAIKFIYSHRDAAEHRFYLEKLQRFWNPFLYYSTINKNKIHLLDILMYTNLNKTDMIEKHHTYIKSIAELYKIDLLDFDFNQGWQDFCKFTDKEIPNASIPKKGIYLK